MGKSKKATFKLTNFKKKKSDDKLHCKLAVVLIREKQE